MLCLRGILVLLLHLSSKASHLASSTVLQDWWRSIPDIPQILRGKAPKNRLTRGEKGGKQDKKNKLFIDTHQIYEALGRAHPDLADLLLQEIADNPSHAGEDLGLGKGLVGHPAPL